MRKRAPFDRQQLANLCRGGMTVARAADRLGIPLRTAERALAELRSSGANLRLPRGRRGKPPKFIIVPTSSGIVGTLCALHHGYASAGTYFTYCFAVIENEQTVAVFAWQPPALGAAKAVCPEAPHGVLALARMVAVPKSERHLRHISKPLRYQMKYLIDRTRWPVLITYSDEGQGHTGHVYKCSGWESTVRVTRPFYVDSQNRRVSIPTSDNSQNRDLRHGGATTLQRWEQWACPHGEAMKWMIAHGWKRIAVPGRVWRSGNPVFTWIRE